MLTEPRFSSKSTAKQFDIRLLVIEMIFTIVTLLCLTHEIHVVRYVNRFILYIQNKMPITQGDKLKYVKFSHVSTLPAAGTVVFIICPSVMLI